MIAGCRPNPVLQRMPSIAQAEAAAPPAPERSSQRPANGMEMMDYPSDAPPPYSLTGDESAPGRKTAAREGAIGAKALWFARRGGWCRVVLFTALVLVIVICLVVGLMVGLRKR